MAASTRSKKPARSKLRRTLRGLLISAVTTLILLGLLEVVARFVLQNEISAFAPVYEQHGTAGYRLIPGIERFAMGAIVKTNSRGRRGRAWEDVKSPDTLRIALIGDSIAFGYGVEFDQTFGEVLARELEDLSERSCEVLNHGVPGYNTAQQLEVLETEALALDPDLVIVLACANDHKDPLWVDDEGCLRWGSPGTPDSRVGGQVQPRSAIWGPLRASALLTWAKLVWTRANAGSSAKRPAEWPRPNSHQNVAEPVKSRVLDPLVSMRDACAARQVPIVLCVLGGSKDYRLLGDAFTERTGAPAIDLLALFPEVGGPQQWYSTYTLGWDSHPNAAVHERWGLEVAKRLRDLDMIQGH